MRGFWRRRSGCFRHYGYAKTNVADIARDLGMSPANIYRFFASKTEIHQAICGRMLAGSYQQAFEISQLPISAADRLAPLSARGVTS